MTSRSRPAGSLRSVSSSNQRVAGVDLGPMVHIAHDSARNVGVGSGGDGELVVTPGNRYAASRPGEGYLDSSQPSLMMDGRAG